MAAIISNRQKTLRINSQTVKKDCLRALTFLELEGSELSVLFVGTQAMRVLNKKFRGIDKTTDVLSFPLYTRMGDIPKVGMPLLGDIVINPVRALAQAKQRGASLHDEIRVLLVHGLLHLLGYDHEKGRLKARLMDEMQEKLMRVLQAPAVC